MPAWFVVPLTAGFPVSGRTTPTLIGVCCALARGIISRVAIAAALNALTLIILKVCIAPILHAETQPVLVCLNVSSLIVFFDAHFWISLAPPSLCLHVHDL